MSSKTKIVVLHMKEIIYTVIFAVLAIILILLLIFMFRPEHRSASKDNRIYTPGIYTSDITLNNTALEVEVTVDESHINSIRFTNLNESITTMYPFIEPAIEDIAEQVYKKQSLDNIQYSSDTPYTSQLIVQAIETALEKSRNYKVVAAFSLHSDSGLCDATRQVLSSFCFYPSTIR